MALSRITEAVASFTDLTIGDDLTLTDDLLLASDANIIKFGADADVTLTHVHNTGLLLNSTSVIQFNDASQNIGAPSATVLDINATDEIELNATLIDVNGNLDVSGTIVAAGALTAATSITVGSAALTEAELEFLDGITAGTAAASKALILDGSTNITGIGTIGSGAITSSGTIQGTTITATTAFVPDASDGAALGTTSLEFSDLFLADQAVINLGADQDVTLTHVADTGILLNSSRKFQFSDAGESIHSDGSKLIITSNSVAFSLPTADGSSGQVLQTNGSGVLSFVTASANTPSSADGQALGSASLEWSDLFLADGGTVTFGNDQDIILTHVADTGLTLSHGGNDDNKPIVFQLKSEEDDVQANELIASIEFAAGDSDGTDGATVAAGIHAIAEGTFSASANATKLVFTTGVSETAAATATAKMTLSSAGLLTIADDLVIKDGGTIGVASDADAITIASNGAVTLTQALAGTSADFDGGVTIDNITIDGTEIDLSSGDLTLDVAGDIILDADGGDVKINDGGTAVAELTNSSTDFVIKSVTSDKDIIFQGNDGGTGFEAARFNMSDRGAFYVGQTNTTILGNGGFAVKPQDANNNVRVDIGADNQAMLLSTEQSTGPIISFYKEAGAIGHIGVGDNDQIYFSRNDVNQGIKLKNSVLMPCNTDGSDSDADQDIGSSSVRWRDLYLSSGVFLGGTGASNELTDYEEGTWTPAFSSTNATFAYASRGGNYTKVGRLVMLSFLILLSGSPGGTTSNSVVISGLPFNSASLVGTYHGGNIGHYFNINLSQTGVLAYQTSSGATTVELKVVGDNLGETAVLASHLNSNAQIRGQIIYHTA